MRIRLFYEKRGFACFVPHVALSTLFARTARRAGVGLSSTEGFSPRARISFGPELPAGVVALNEPAELWVDRIERTSNGPAGEDRFLENPFYELPEILNPELPEGFRVTGCAIPGEGAPALGRECGAARYLLWTRNGLAPETLLSHMERFYGRAVLDGTVLDGEPDSDNESPTNRLSVVLADPAKNGLGGFVKFLAAEGAADGWRHMCAVRLGLGRWNGKRLVMMNETQG